MAGMKLSFVADVRQFLTGSKKVEGGLDDVGDALDELASEAKSSSSKIGNELDDAAREGGQAAEKLERKFKDTFDGVKDRSKRAGDELGDNTKRGAKQADDALETLNENAGQNAKELGASFDGSFDGLVDGVQGFVAEALEGFGAVGIAGGVALAAAIGIGMQALEQSAEKANTLTEDAVEFGNSLASATPAEAAQVLADRYAEVADKIGDARSMWELWQSRARTQGEQLADAIKQGAVNAADLSDAFSDPDPVSRMDSLRRVQDQLNASIAESTDEYEKAANGQLIAKDAVENWADANADAAAEAKRATDISKEAKTVIDEEVATQEAAVAILEAKAAALGQTVDEYQTAQAETERATEVQEGFNDAIESAGDSVSVYEGVLERKAAAEGKSVEDTSVSIDEMIAEWNRQADEARAFEGNLAIIAANGGQALADELRAKGPEAAGATADLIAKASPDQQRTAFESWGKATGQGMGNAMGDGIAASAPQVQSDLDYLRQGIRTPSPIEMPVKLPALDAVQQGLDSIIRNLRKDPVDIPYRLSTQRAV